MEPIRSILEYGANQPYNESALRDDFIPMQGHEQMYDPDYNQHFQIYLAALR